MHVIKTGGAVLAHPDTQQKLAQAWKNRTEKWVLVHGGGPQLDQALCAVQSPLAKMDGLRITTTEGAETVRRVMNILGAELTAGLRQAGIPAVHVSPEDHAVVAVTKTNRKGDLGRVGTVTDVRTARIRQLLRENKLPVVTPVGWDAEGPLNINADEGAAMVAVALGAKRLVLVTDVDAVLDGNGKPIQSLGPDDARRLIDAGVAEGGMHAKLNQAMAAVAEGVAEVCIGSLSSAWDDNRGTRLAIPQLLEATTTV
jgi:acetylglutamate kinase